jgi:hypothetical protein
MIEKNPQMIEVIIATLIVVFFSIVHATSQLKVHRDSKLEFDIVDFVILMIIGCGSGALFGIATMLVWDQNFILVILMSAVGAVSGMAGLNKFAALMVDILTGMLKK